MLLDLKGFSKGIFLLLEKEYPMRITRYPELANDVLKLYASIHHRGLEDLFIKLANVDVDTFYTWLLSNSRVRRKLRNPSVYDAFEMLCQLRSTYAYNAPIDVPSLKITMYGGGQKSLMATEAIMGFGEIENDPSVKDLIQPFKDIIDIIIANNKIDRPVINSKGLIIDITIIKNEFLQTEIGEEEVVKKPNVAQQKRNMFQYLLSRFTDEVAAAAEGAGLSDLAEDVRGGALAKVASQHLSTYIQYGRSNQEKFAWEAKKMAQTIMKQYDSKMENFNHDLIAMRFMALAGAISQQQVSSLRMKYDANKNISDLLEGDEKYPGIDFSDMITDDKRLNPDYLFMLVSFFYMLQRLIGVPGF